MDAVAERMIGAARAWLDSLDTAERDLGAWPFPADEERRSWFYTPTDHGGVAVGDMDPAQQQLAMRVVASGLSRAGYVTVTTIMGLENALDESEGWRPPLPGRERTRDPGRYYLRVFGSPGPSGAWSWRFGGHHVSIHHLVVDGVVRATTPCFLGADPANAALLGPHLLRPLGAVEDLGRELVRSLDDAQRVAALISPVAPADIASGNRPRTRPGDGPLSAAEIWRGTPVEPALSRFRAGSTAMDAALGFGAEHFEMIRLGTQPKGLTASLLGGGQREVLRALLDTYLGRIPDALAGAEAAKYAGDAIASLHFAWAGGVEPGQPHYYRIEGPRLLVEYDNTQRDVNHIHSVWRDPEGDFGGDLLGDHYRASPHDH